MTWDYHVNPVTGCCAVYPSMQTPSMAWTCIHTFHTYPPSMQTPSMAWKASIAVHLFSWSVKPRPVSGKRYCPPHSFANQTSLTLASILYPLSTEVHADPSGTCIHTFHTGTCRSIWDMQCWKSESRPSWTAFFRCDKHQYCPYVDLI